MSQNPLLKKPISFCFTPYFDRFGSLPRPCGHCIHCRSIKKNEWSARVIADYHALGCSAVFLTLDYAPEHLPNARPVFNQKTGEVFRDKHGTYRFCGDLQRSHANAFFNKFKTYFQRKFGQPFKGRYFLVGEYGGKYGRPHYHALILGVDINQRDVISLLESCWNYGHCTIEKPRNAEHCIKYIASYCFDSIGSKSAFMKHNNVSQVPFCNVSKGFGRSLIDFYLRFIHTNARSQALTPKEYFLQNLHIFPYYQNQDGIQMLPRYARHKVLEALNLRWREEDSSLKTGFRFIVDERVRSFLEARAKQDFLEKLTKNFEYFDKKYDLDKIDSTLKEWQSRLDSWFEHKMWLLNIKPPKNPYELTNYIDKNFVDNINFELIKDKPYKPRNVVEWLYYQIVDKQKEQVFQWRVNRHCANQKRKDIVGQAFGFTTS